MEGLVFAGGYGNAAVFIHDEGAFAAIGFGRLVGLYVLQIDDEVLMYACKGILAQHAFFTHAETINRADDLAKLSALLPQVEGDVRAAVFAKHNLFLFDQHTACKAWQQKMGVHRDGSFRIKDPGIYLLCLK